MAQQGAAQDFDISYPYSSQHSSFADISWTGTLIGVFIAAYLFVEAWNHLKYTIQPPLARTRHVFASLMPSSLRPGTLGRPSNVLTQSTTNRGNINEANASSQGASMVSNMLGAVTRGRRKTLLNAPKGLGNWDNSCYQNSVLQAIAAMQSFERFLDQVAFNVNGLPDISTTGSLRALGRELNDTTDEATYRWTPAKLKSMSSWQQQDAQEYFSKLMEAVEKEVAAGPVGALRNNSGLQHALLPHATSGSKTEVETADSTSQARTSPSQEPHESTRKSLPKASIQNPMEGLLAQRVGCTKCGYTEGLSLIPFNCITVPLGEDDSYDLHDCLDEYTALDYIEGVECAKCSLLHAKDTLEHLASRAQTSLSASEGQMKEVLTKHLALLAARGQAVDEALQDDDFSETCLTQRCQIKGSQRKSSRKSRQAAIIRKPTCLAVHVNRSIYDEYSGRQLKNYADVRFPLTLDITPWCVGGEPNDSSKTLALWPMNPSKSMTEGQGAHPSGRGTTYELKAVITHYGRHENGHYICYRRSYHSQSAFDNDSVKTEIEAPLNTTNDNEWWRLSDDNVTPVSETEVLAQEGAFMLFYELTAPVNPSRTECATAFEEKGEAVRHGFETTNDEDTSHEAAVMESGSLSADALSNVDSMGSSTDDKELHNQITQKIAEGPDIRPDSGADALPQEQDEPVLLNPSNKSTSLLHAEARESASLSETPRSLLTT